jgi:anti-sigma B factor antagonist
MKINARDENAVGVFVLEGSIDTQHVVDVDQALRAAIAQGKHNIVLDMAQVPYISGVGLTALVDVLAQNREQGGDLKLVALHKQVMRAFQLVGYDEFFAIYDTLEQAMADF